MPGVASDRTGALGLRRRDSGGLSIFLKWSCSIQFRRLQRTLLLLTLGSYEAARKTGS